VVTANDNANANGATSWVILSAKGQVLSAHEDPVAYCSRLRRDIEAKRSVDGLRRFWNRNAVTVEILKRGLPDLKTEKGEHYSAILEGLFKARILELGPKNGRVAKNANGRNGAHSPKRQNAAGDPIDKALLAIATPRRVRDKEHLKHVARQACMVCGRRPSEAHHLRFAQLRALSSKPSDEWVVPLCATHHRSLHQVGDEEEWWVQLDLDPLIEAQRLWEVTRIEKDERSSRHA
jgi:hypothetical protein